MSTADVREIMERYTASQHTDLSMLADDVVFTTMATGEEYQGRDAVAAMLHHVYHVAFDARAEPRTLVCDDRHAVLEAVIVGRHTGEFAGIPATGRDVRVPICVVYDIAERKIRRARVYFEIPVLMQQIGAAAGTAAPR